MKEVKSIDMRREEKKKNKMIRVLGIVLLMSLTYLEGDGGS